jgi:general secretion pathway protein A
LSALDRSHAPASIPAGGAPDVARPLRVSNSNPFTDFMYAAHFGLAEPPFSLAPDPRYLYMSERHAEALAHLVYGVGEGGGFVQLTGEVGTGKTTVCRCLLERLPPQVDVGLILNPKLTAIELLAAVCDELGVSYAPGTMSTKLLVDALYGYLFDAHARGRRTVLIIDEAQNLTGGVLEQIRLLTNLETTTTKLLQIVLIGQPELIRTLTRPKLRQVAQRITARYHLLPFSNAETRAYVRHRLQVAGRTEPIFGDAALRRVHRFSGGIPRLINVICDRALLGAYAQGRTRVDAGVVSKAAREVLGPVRRWPFGRAVLGIAAAVLAGVAIGLPGVRSTAAEVTGRVVHAALEMKGAWLKPSTDAALPAAVSPPSSVVSPRSSAISPPSPVGSPPSPVVSPRSPVGSPRSPVVSPRSSVGSPPALVVSPPSPIVPDVRAAAGDSGELRSPDRLTTVLSDASIHSDKPAAFANLYARWGLDYDVNRGGPACDADRLQGLRCLFKRGNWNTLRGFNLPAIMELTGPGGKLQYATLIALAPPGATLAFGRQQLSFPLSEIDGFWNGAFILLWPAPRSGAIVLAPGTRGGDVTWLRQRLAELAGAPVGEDNRDLYDDDLRRRVLAFQHDRGLTADGIAGEETLAHVTLAVSGAGVPLLTPRQP